MKGEYIELPVGTEIFYKEKTGRYVPVGSEFSNEIDVTESVEIEKAIKEIEKEQSK